MIVRRLATLVAVLLLAGSGPIASATHMVPQSNPVPAPPMAPDNPHDDTGVAPLDRIAGDAYGAVVQTYEGTSGGTYRVLSDGWNQLEGEVPRQPMLIYRDGAGNGSEGPDSRYGGYGDWRTYNEPWERSDEAAATGEWGLSTPRDGPYYPLGVSGMLLTPELDLQTGFLDPQIARFNRETQVVRDAWASSACASLSAADPARELVCARFGSDGALCRLPGTAAGCVVDPQAAPLCTSHPTVRSVVPCPPPTVPSAGTVTGLFGSLLAIPAPEQTVTMTLQMRYNLGQGRDGVTVLAFTSPPEEAVTSPADCNMECSVLVPTGGYPQPQVVALENQPGWTGQSTWQQQSFDLSQFLGRSVWIGFLFASVPGNSQSYFESVFFPQSMDFFGLQVDDLNVVAPAAHHNLHVRPLHEPNLKPYGQVEPALAPNTTIPVRTEVVNTGLAPSTARVHAALHAPDGQVLASDVSPPVELQPTDIVDVVVDFPPLPLGTRAYARVWVEHVQQETTAWEAATGSPDAMPEDDTSPPLWFRIARVSALVPGAMIRDRDSVPVGEDVQFSMSFQNLGNIHEDLRIAALVLDVTDSENIRPAQELLAPEHINQGFSLAPGEQATAQWTLKGATPGQYRLFVSSGGAEPFDAERDLGSKLSLPWDIPFLDGDQVTLDGVVDDASDGGVWSKAFRIPLAMSNHETPVVFGAGETNVQADVRLFNDADYLYASINYRAFACGTGIQLFFDDFADGVGLDGGEDSIQAFTVSPTPIDMQFDASTLEFVPEPTQAPNDYVARNCANPSITFEARRPIAGAELASGPGDLLGMLFRVQYSAGLGAHYPTGTNFRDGGVAAATGGGLGTYGLVPPDGAITDEWSGWQRVRLGAEPDDPSRITVPIRVLGPGFGVERAAPPLLLETFEDCDLHPGWTQTSVLAAHRSSISPFSPPAHFEANTDQTDKWNCGNYGEEGNIIFEGLAQDEYTQCVATCPPYSILGTRYTRQAGTFMTPPIDVGEDQDPWLILRHQTSNQLEFCDDPAIRPDERIGSSCQARENNPFLRVLSAARVMLQVWNETLRVWDMPILLLPQAGYSTEASEGIADPRLGTAGRTPAQGNSDEATACPGRDANGNPVATVVNHDNCGWWSPAGSEPSYRPANESIAVGGAFYGSPWRVDRFPLSGMHGWDGLTPVDVRGRTVRLHFQYDRGPLMSGGEVLEDIGWRIGAVTVAEAPRFRRDVAVTAIDIGSGLLDPETAGVGPATDLPVQLTLRNEGTLDARRLTIRVTGTDPRFGAEPTCVGESQPVPGILASGEELVVETTCRVADADGVLVRLEATIEAEEGDDFPQDNHHRAREVYTVRTTRDVAVRVAASPETASDEFERTLFITVENRGNVPVTDFNVDLHVLRRSGAGQGDVVSEATRRWHVEGVLAPGTMLPIQDRTLETDPMVLPPRDLLFDPPEHGTYDVVATVDLEGDLDPSNDVRRGSLSALSSVYFDDLDRPATASPEMVRGARSVGGDEGIWSVIHGGDQRGQRLRAGDPATNEIPHTTDAWIELPPMDLTSLKDATLAFNHLYDLESSFDAARVEISTDDGSTWRPLSANPAPLAGLPEGYPSVDLLGSSVLNDGPDARAFTGRSEEHALPGSGGFIASQFDLSSDPQMRQRTVLESFPLEEPHARPNAIPSPAEGGRFIQYTHPSWAMAEPHNQTNQRFWWIENATEEEPRPLSGRFMWWSGSAGATEPQVQPVCTAVGFEAQPPAVHRDGEFLTVSWWEWRAGWQEGDRDGTGGTFNVELRRQGVDPVTVEAPVVAARDDGWTRRAFDVARGPPFEVWFNYTSFPSESDVRAVTQNNRGWFLDDLRFESWLEVGGLRTSGELIWSDDVENVDLDPDTLSGGVWNVTRSTAPGCSPTRWSVVERGAARQVGGWAIGEMDVPGSGVRPVWRFSAENAQGYPHLADSRLVTPVVDLSRIASDQASLRFSHSFGFEAVSKAPDPNKPNDGDFLSAVDGGTVEYQVFDEATGTFGPWKQLFRDFRDVPDRILFTSAFDGSNNVVNGLVDDSDFLADGEVPNWDRIPQTGYNAVVERGLYRAGNDFFYNVREDDYYWSGPGYSFEQFDSLARFQAWNPFPVSYAFSGKSDGWQEDSWDISPLIGQRVRFGFHAQSNPSYITSSEEVLPGWSIADVAVDGQIFVGQPVRLRLRVATDESVTQGSWEVDDLLVVGERFSRNIIIKQDEQSILVAPSTKVTIPSAVVNLGTEPRAGLALALKLLDEETRQPIDDFEVAIDAPGLDGSRVAFSEPGTRYFGPFAMSEPGDRMDFQIQVQLPAGASRTRVMVDVLEDQGTPQRSRYVQPDNEVTGAASGTWTITGIRRTDLALDPPAPGAPSVAVVPGSAALGDPVVFSTLVANRGTTAPETVIRWTVHEVVSKGSEQQTGTVERLKLVHQEDQELATVAPGTSMLHGPDPFTASKPGLYRVTATLRGDGQVVDTASREFLVEMAAIQYEVDFSEADDAQSGWSAGPTPPRQNGGGSHSGIDWRVEDGLFLWGVTRQQFSSGTTYCSHPQSQCDGTNQRGNTGQTYYGLEGIGLGPEIDLTRVPNGEATLGLVHGHRFVAGDGGILEARALRDGTSQSAFTCNGQDDWFLLEPIDPSQMSGQAQSLPAQTRAPPQTGPYTVANRINPIAPSSRTLDVFGGPPAVDQVTLFDLSQPVSSACIEDVQLLNYTVQLRFHVGTQPGSTGPPGPAVQRVGALGWQVGSLQISSMRVEVEEPSRSIPLLDGATKTFMLGIRNAGQTHENLQVWLDEASSTLPDPGWLKILQPELSLGPGQTAQVPYQVAIPADPMLSRGTYTAALGISAVGRPGIVAVATIEIVLQENPLPDLAVRVDMESDGKEPEFDVGTIAPVHVTVSNVGRLGARPVPVRIEAWNVETKAHHDVGTMNLPALCALTECGTKGSSTTRTLEWEVPEEPGRYEIVAWADPYARLIEERVANNVAVVVANAVPLQRPDIRVSELRLGGVGADGYVEDGSVVAVSAVYENVGNAPAQGVQAVLLSGSAELTSQVLPTLSPGAKHEVTAFKVASAGESTITATAIAPGALELRVDNNELTRVLRARSHDLVWRFTEEVPSVDAGQSVTFMVGIENRGNAVEKMVVAPSAEGWPVSIHPNPVTVAPGSTSWTSVRVVVPETAAAGDHVLAIATHPATNPAVVVNLTLPLRVAQSQAPPLATVGSVDLSPGRIAVPVVIDGRSNVPRNLSIELLSPPWTHDAVRAEVPAAATTTVPVPIMVPAVTPTGPVELRFAIREGGDLVAEAEAVLQMPEIVAANASWHRAVRVPGDVTGPQRLLFEIDVANAGNVPVRLNALVVDLPPEIVGRPTDAVQLPPGEQGLLGVELEAPADLTGELLGRIAIWMEHNGSEPRLVEILDLPPLEQYPNLVVERIEIPQRTQKGDDVTLRVHVANLGQLAGGETPVAVYVNGALVSDTLVAPLAPGQTTTMEVQLRASSAGKYLVTAIVDAQDDLVEAREDDNGASAVVTVDKGSVGDRAREVPLPLAWVLLPLVAALAVRRRRS